MIDKKLDTITKEDLFNLIDNKILENKTLEYKKKLPDFTSKESKEEFFADITSFANSNGGDLIFGIDEKNGEPDNLCGFIIDNVDQTLIRIQDLLNNSNHIKPRIYGIDFKIIDLDNSNYALIIRIPKSWNSPHRVRKKDANRFYIRAFNKKEELDIDELRIAFNFTDSINEKIKNFRSERIGKIISENTPIYLESKSKTLINLIPLSSFLSNDYCNFNLPINNLNILHHISEGIGNTRYNFDGVIRTKPEHKIGHYYSYVQLFKNGIIESVDTSLLSSNYICSSDYESKIINAFYGYIKTLKLLQINFPMIIFITLIGVKGFEMDLENRSNKNRKIDRDILLLPEIILENNDKPLELVLKPCFDTIWNSCGFKGSINYDNEGNWINNNLLYNES